jgi:hypothetical protein
MHAVPTALAAAPVSAPVRLPGAVTAGPDETDVRLAAAGDHEAFGRLYWRHADRIKALARRLLLTPLSV